MASSAWAGRCAQRLTAVIVAIAGHRCGQNPAFCLRWFRRRPDLPRIMPWRASIRPRNRAAYPRNQAAPMTLSIAHSAETHSPMRGLLPLWVGLGIYALFLRGRQPAADRPRYVVADHRRPVDARQSRGAAHRHLFLHHARPALDFDAVAGAGALRRSLCAVRLERAGGAGGSRDRGDVCAAGEIPQPASEPERHDGVRRRSIGADGAASAGAAACAGDAGDGGLGRRTDGRQRIGAARRHSGCCR